jgi:hypothetical protein
MNPAPPVTKTFIVGGPIRPNAAKPADSPQEMSHGDHTFANGARKRRRCPPAAAGKVVLGGIERVCPIEPLRPSGARGLLSSLF